MRPHSPRPMHHRPPPTILSRYSRSHFYPPSPSPASLPLSGKGKEKVKASAVEEEDVVDKEEHGVDEEGDGRFEEYSKEACDGESALLGARMFSARAGGSPLSGRGTFKTSLIVTSFFAVLLEAPVSLFVNTMLLCRITSTSSSTSTLDIDTKANVASRN